MSYADVFGGQGSPQWVTLATGVGGKSQPVPARSMSGYRFRNMSGCVVQLVVDGTLQDEFEPYSEGSGYLGYPGQSIQQVQYLVQNGDPVELSNYAIASWRCLVELVPVDLPYQRVRMSATITGTVQLAPGTSINVGNSPTVLQGGSSPWQTGNVREYLSSILVQGTFNTLTNVGTQAVQNYQTMIFFGTGQSVLQLRVTGHQTGLVFFDAPITGLQVYPVPLVSAQDTSLDFWVRNGSTLVGLFINIYSISSAGPVLPLTNYGGAPLTVQPASGSSQTVVPGAAAAASILTGFSGAPGMSSVGAAFTRPASIYGLFAAVQATLATPANYVPAQFCFALQGVTSGTRVYLGMVTCPMGTPNGGFVGWAGEVNEIFPYPLSAATLWPSDTQLQAQVGAFSGGLTPVAQISLLTG